MWQSYRRSISAVKASPERRYANSPFPANQQRTGSIQLADSDILEPGRIVMVLQRYLTLLARLLDQQIVDRRRFAPSLRYAARDLRRLQASLDDLLSVQPMLEVIALDHDAPAIELPHRASTVARRGDRL